MKKLLALILAAVLFALVLGGCGKKMKTLHCDNCGKAVEVEADSKMEEDWEIFCEDCQKELGLDELTWPGDVP